MSLKFLTNPPVNCIQYFRQVGTKSERVRWTGIRQVGIRRSGIRQFGIRRNGVGPFKLGWAKAHGLNRLMLKGLRLGWGAGAQEEIILYTPLWVVKNIRKVYPNKYLPNKSARLIHNISILFIILSKYSWNIVNSKFWHLLQQC